MKINVHILGQQHQINLRYKDVKKSAFGSQLVSIVQNAVDSKLIDSNAKSFIKEKMKELSRGVCLGHTYKLLHLQYHPTNSTANLHQKKQMKDIAIRQLITKIACHFREKIEESIVTYRDKINIVKNYVLLNHKNRDTALEQINKAVDKSDSAFLSKMWLEKSDLQRANLLWIQDRIKTITQALDPEYQEKFSSEVTKIEPADEPKKDLQVIGNSLIDLERSMTGGLKQISYIKKTFIQPEKIAKLLEKICSAHNRVFIQILKIYKNRDSGHAIMLTKNEKSTAIICNVQGMLSSKDQDKTFFMNTVLQNHETISQLAFRVYTPK